MAEERSEPREINWSQLLPWTVLFRGFRVAIDLGNLSLAAAGIIAMAFGWWVLALLFSPGPKPDYLKDYQRENGWAEFKEDYRHWDLRYETAAPADSREIVGAGDLADTSDEYKILRDLELALKTNTLTREQVPARLNELVAKKQISREQADRWAPRLGLEKPVGRLRTWPWFEDRGPNPFLLVTGQAGTLWEPGQFLNWLLTDQVPVLIEPLVKLFRPAAYFFNPRAGFWARVYFLLVLVWTLAVWALFGGAIARNAAVQIARQEKIGPLEALRFAARRYISLLTAPLFPLVIVAVIVLVLVIFGLFHMIPGFGDIVVDGLFWWLPLLLGLAMAVVLVGLVGWPLMIATVSTEGTDTWEAVSRSYSYVYQAPWHYIFYGAVALVYGAVLVFFVGLMGSLMVYLAKWGVSQGTARVREPSYLFVYAPTSFGWRALLLEGGKVDGEVLAENGRINERAYSKLVGNDPDYQGADRMTWYNKVGAFLVAVWLYLAFLLILGFGYSYFWSAGTIIYLLLRRKVDDAEMDEIYLEEEDQDLSYAPAAAPAPAPSSAPAGTGQPLQMVEPPTLRTAPAPAAAPPTSTPPAPREEVTTGTPRPPQTPAEDVSPSPPPRPDGESLPPGGAG